MIATAVAAGTPMNLHVLIYAQDAGYGESLTKLIQTWDVKVTLASNLREAKQALSLGTIHLSLLSCRSKDSAEFLQWLRSDVNGDGFPVIALSEQCGDREIFELYHHGADFVLEKPINPQELRSILRA